MAAFRHFSVPTSRAAVRGRPDRPRGGTAARAEAKATVGDAMTPRDSGIVTLRPSMKLLEAVRVMRETDVSFAPVVADDNKLIGVISETDVLPVVFAAAGDTELLYTDLGGSRVFGEVSTADVGGAMVRTAVTVNPDTFLEDAAHRMLSAGIHVLPVVEGETLVGVISRGDLIDKSIELLFEPIDVEVE